MTDAIQVFQLCVAVFSAWLLFLIAFYFLVFLRNRAGSLLALLEAALRRYAYRGMVIRNYYNVERMQAVREYENPTPFEVEMFKQRKGKS